MSAEGHGTSVAGSDTASAIGASARPAAARTARAGRGFTRFASWSPIALSLLLLVAVWLQPQDVFDPAWVFTSLNLGFLTVVPLLAAGLAIAAYRRTGVGAVLALGTGMVAIGLGAGILPAVLLYTSGANATVTVHNVSSLLAAACHLAAALGGVAGLSLGSHRGRHVVVAYGGAALIVVAVLAATLANATPVFWTAHGPTVARQMTVGLAIALFVLTASAWWQTAMRDRSIRFLVWYVPGLTIFAVGLAGVLEQNVVGGLIGWIGRTGQYLGAVYMLVAVAIETLPSGSGKGRGTLGVALMQAGLPFRPLVESTSDAVVALGRDRRVVYVNEAASRMFGFEPEEAFDADPLELLAGGATDEARESLRDLLAVPAAPIAPRREPIVLVGRGRRHFPAEIATFASPEDPRLVVCVIADVSERVQARAELEQRVRERTAELEATNAELERANAAKDDFLGLVSHELKTPITTIIAASSLLQRKIAVHDADGLVADVVSDAHRLNGVVDNLLALTRLETGRHIPTEPVALDRLVARVVAAVGREYPERVVEVTAESGVIVEGNDDQLEIVLRNYLSNALKFSTSESPVRVALSVEFGRAVVSVVDSGPGIRPDEAETVFEAFYRSPATSHRPGMGIGLAVCRRIVEALDGTVRAAPRTDGPGSVFEFSLPLAARD